jgi:HK97 family phage portal protein
MGLISSFREFFQRKPSPGVTAKIVPTGNVGRDLPNPQDVANYAEEGYRRNAVIYACVNILSRTATQPKPVAERVDRSGEAVPLEPGHALAMLLKRPNAEQSYFEWIEQLIQQFAISGNSFTHKVRARRMGRNGVGQLVELWNLRPDKTRVVPDERGFVTGYKFPVNGEVPRETIPFEDVMHMRAPDPLDDFYGLAPIHVIARATDMDNEAVKYLLNFFLGGAQPGGWLVFNTTVNPSERERILGMLRDQHGREGGWHTWGILDSDVKWEQTGSRLDQLNLQSIFNHTETRICAAFGVHPILVAAWAGLERSTLANYETALKDFWVDTAGPMYRRLADKLTMDVAHEFGEDLQISFDFSDVTALQEDRDSQVKRGLLGWKEGILTLSEARVLFGEDPWEGPEGDERKAMSAPPANPMLPRGDEADDEEEQERQIRRLGPGEVQVIPADKFPTEDIWLELHQEADKLAPKIKAAFNKAVKAAHVELDIDRLESVLSETDGRDRPAAEALVINAWTDAGVPILEAGLLKPLGTLFTRGENAANDIDLPDIQPDEMQQEGMAAEAWATAHIGEFVTGVSEQLRESIRDTVERMFTENITVDLAARMMRDSIGLNRPQRNALFAEIKGMVESGVSGAKIDAAMGKTVRRMIRQRAEMISRTEGITALSHGQEHRWNEAINDGIVDRAQVVQVWITTLDGRQCPICEPMPDLNSGGVPLGGDFITGTGGSVKMPPAHVMCRCARGLKRKETA